MHSLTFLVSFWLVALLAGFVSFLILSSAISADQVRLAVIIVGLKLFVSSSPKFSNRPKGFVFVPLLSLNTRKLRRFRRPRHQGLRRRINRRHPLKMIEPEDIELEFSHEEFKSQFGHRFLHIPEFTYGSGFQSYCKSIHPISDKFQLKDFIATTKVKNKFSNSLMVTATSFCGFPSVGEFVSENSTDRTLPVVIDSGASLSVTPIESDFVGPIVPLKNSTVRGLTSTTVIRGIGTVRWTIRDLENVIATIETKAYFIPEAEIRLFSPQVYLQEQHGGDFLIRKDGTTLTLRSGIQLKFPYFKENNLPMFLLESSFDGLDLGNLHDLPMTEVYISVVEETNQNLTNAQKELLVWHWKLGHVGLDWLKQLLRPRSEWAKLDATNPQLTTPVIVSKFPGTSRCPHPKCAACLVSKMSRRGPQTSVERHRPEKLMELRSGNLVAGDVVSMDQYESGILGRLPNTRGKEDDKEKYTGGTIFVDHASGLIWLQNQVSLRTGETLRAKMKFERFAAGFGVKIKKYHGDNGVFAANEFRDHVQQHGQSLEFSGVGAHHQNGVAERAIQTVTSWARTMLLHSCLHWPVSTNLSLWPFALEHAVLLWNNIPRKEHGLSPIELFSGQKVSDYELLRRMHVWGCPVYVLDPKLQDGKKLPKWSPRSRRGQFVGFSTGHSSTVGLILNQVSGMVTPQYHVVYDDFFTTVVNADNRVTLEDLEESIEWNEFLRTNSERYVEQEFDERNQPLPMPELQEEWLTPEELNERQLQREQQPVLENPIQVVPENEAEVAPIQDDVHLEPEIEEVEEGINEGPKLPRYPQRERRRNNRYFNQNTINLSSTATYRSQRKVRFGELDAAFLGSLDWNNLTNILKSSDASQFMAMTSQFVDPETQEVDWFHPLTLSVKANAEDNPRWEEALNGPDAEGYWQAMEAELDALCKMNAWEVVPREQADRVIPSTWVFRCKRFPDGSVRKLKARFCVRGDQQIEGVDFFDTYAPVVSWTTVRFLLVLSVVLKLATKQVDYVSAFIQAHIHDDVYVEMPRGFREPGKVLKLKRSLYGLRQSPRNFFEHLKGVLLKCGFQQSACDPCLFVADRVLCLTYVDDCLFFAPTEKDIDEMIRVLREKGMELNVESDVAGFLGVLLKRNEENATITMTQTGLIDRVIASLGLEGANAKDTPAEFGALPADKDGEPCNGEFNYASVVGMLMYLCSNTRPDITFATHQCARYTHRPRRIHELAVKRIGRYLLGTRDRGLVFKPDGTLRIECFVDADFAGLWGYEEKNDPNCVKSRTGYVIMLGNCPVMWTSKLQDEIATSTMHAEYIALSMAMRELLPFRNLAIEIVSNLGLGDETLATIQSTVWEDNVGALTLANLEPPRVTPKSKHFAVKYHWFRSELKPNEIEIKKVESDLQLADILTKALRREKFREMRKLFSGW